MDTPEVVSPGAATEPAAPPAKPRWSLTAVTLAFANRLFLFFFLLVFLPYPFDALPYLETIGLGYGKAQEALVAGVAQALGIVADPARTGSSDTPYRYLEAATLFALALILALAWALPRRGAPVGEKVEYGLRAYIRLGMGSVLLAYGWQKVFPIQMSAPGPDRLLIPFGESSPMGLVWTFMGASAPYQIFAGLGEAIAGFLLLWRRTALLGLLVGIGVMANVVALNFCYDVPVKLSSSLYLLMLLFLLAPHLPRLAAFLVFNRPTRAEALDPFPIRRRWLRRTALVLQLAFAAWVTIQPALQNYRYLTTQGRLAPRGPLDGFYRVESFSRDGVLDRANEDARRWVRVGIGHSRLGTIQRADGRAVRYWLGVIRANQTLILASYDDPDTQPELRYSKPGPGLLRLEGSFEGAKTVVLLRRLPESTSLLMTRGFHWINEVPLNR